MLNIMLEVNRLHKDHSLFSCTRIFNSRSGCYAYTVHCTAAGGSNGGRRALQTQTWLIRLHRALHCCRSR